MMFFVMLTMPDVFHRLRVKASESDLLANLIQLAAVCAQSVSIPDSIPPIQLPFASAQTFDLDPFYTQTTSHVASAPTF